MPLREARYQIWAIVWTVITLILCNVKFSDSIGESSLFFEGFDKLAHTGFFFVLSILLFYGKIRYQHSYAFRSVTIAKVLLIVAVIGGSIELLQWKIFIWRGAEWWDFFCDMLGGAMGVASYILLHASHFNRQKSEGK